MSTAVVILGRNEGPLTLKLRAGRVSYSVRPLKKRPQSVVRLSSETERTFNAISDPQNAHRFSADAAFEAFARQTA